MGPQTLFSILGAMLMRSNQTRVWPSSMGEMIKQSFQIFKLETIDHYVEILDILKAGREEFFETTSLL